MSLGPATARRARAHERARRDILESAARVFARRGYAAATLSELAAAAGYAPPSLYRYFRSKEEIFESLRELLLSEVQAIFEAPVDRKQSLAARLSALILALYRHHEGRLEVLQPLDAQGSRDESQAVVEEFLAGWLRRNAGRGELRVPPLLAARAAAGILLAHKNADAPKGEDPAALARSIADLILHGVSA
jgi:AcrR family transcriptional regulator